jgi:enoyl-CoA hydratase
MEVWAMTEQPVVYAGSDGVALITLNRPRARNAIDSALAAALTDAFTRAEADTQIRAIVVTGTDPALCAGLDLKEFARLQRPPAGASAAITMAGELTKPTIGAINGPVMTGGLELVLGLDVLIASERARFADTHAAVGILPGGGMTARLPRVVGSRMALEMSYTGRVIGADEALRIGLVNRVVPHGDLLPAARAMAATIASRDAAVLRELKKLYQVSNSRTLGEALAHELRERDARRSSGRGLIPSAD